MRLATRTVSVVGWIIVLFFCAVQNEVHAQSSVSRLPATVTCLDRPVVEGGTFDSGTATTLIARECMGSSTDVRVSGAQFEGNASLLVNMTGLCSVTITDCEFVSGAQLAVFGVLNASDTNFTQHCGADRSLRVTVSRTRGEEAFFMLFDVSLVGHVAVDGDGSGDDNGRAELFIIDNNWTLTNRSRGAAFRGDLRPEPGPTMLEQSHALISSFLVSGKHLVDGRRALSLVARNIFQTTVSHDDGDESRRRFIAGMMVFAAVNLRIRAPVMGFQVFNGGRYIEHANVARAEVSTISGNPLVIGRYCAVFGATVVGAGSTVLIDSGVMEATALAGEVYGVSFQLGHSSPNVDLVVRGDGALFGFRNCTVSAVSEGESFGFRIVGTNAANTDLSDGGAIVIDSCNISASGLSYSWGLYFQYDLSVGHLLSNGGLISVTRSSIATSSGRRTAALRFGGRRGSGFVARNGSGVILSDLVVSSTGVNQLAIDLPNEGLDFDTGSYFVLMRIDVHIANSDSFSQSQVIRLSSAGQTRAQFTRWSALIFSHFNVVHVSLQMATIVFAVDLREFTVSGASAVVFDHLNVTLNATSAPYLSSSRRNAVVSITGGETENNGANFTDGAALVVARSRCHVESMGTTSIVTLYDREPRNPADTRQISFSDGASFAMYGNELRALGRCAEGTTCGSMSMYTISALLTLHALPGGTRAPLVWMEDTQLTVTEQFSDARTGKDDRFGLIQLRVEMTGTWSFPQQAARIVTDGVTAVHDGGSGPPIVLFNGSSAAVFGAVNPRLTTTTCSTTLNRRPVTNSALLGSSLFTPPLPVTTAFASSGCAARIHDGCTPMEQPPRWLHARPYLVHARGCLLQVNDTAAAWAGWGTNISAIAIRALEAPVHSPTVSSTMSHSTEVKRAASTTVSKQTTATRATSSTVPAPRHDFLSTSPTVPDPPPPSHPPRTATAEQPTDTSRSHTPTAVQDGPVPTGAPQAKTMTFSPTVDVPSAPQQEEVASLIAVAESPAVRATGAAASVAAAVALSPTAASKPTMAARALGYARACSFDGGDDVNDGWPGQEGFLVVSWRIDGAVGSNSDQAGTAETAALAAGAMLATSALVIAAIAATVAAGTAMPGRGETRSGSDPEDSSLLYSICAGLMVVASSYFGPNILEAAAFVLGSKAGATGLGVAIALAGTVATVAACSILGAAGLHSLPFFLRRCNVHRILEETVGGLRSPELTSHKAATAVDLVVAAAIGVLSGIARTRQSQLLCRLCAVVSALLAVGLTVYFVLQRPFAAKIENIVSAGMSACVAALSALVAVAVLTDGAAAQEGSTMGDAIGAFGLAAMVSSIAGPVILAGVAAVQACTSTDVHRKRSALRSDDDSTAADALLHVPLQQSSTGVHVPPAAPAAGGQRLESAGSGGSSGAGADARGAGRHVNPLA